MHEVLGEGTRASGALRLFTSGDIAAQSRVASQLLGTAVRAEPLPDAYCAVAPDLPS